MPIRNKDGTLYKLQGVNPLMQEQDHWQEGWKIHYVEGEKVVVQDPKRVSEFLPEDKPEPIIAGVGFVKQTEILYCLPLIVRVEEDPLYGQKKKVTAWGDKFNFEAVKVDYTGLTAVFFARLPAQVIESIGPGSIIFEFAQRQWWKVNGTEPSEDGIRIYCMPSELKPSFS